MKSNRLLLLASVTCSALPSQAIDHANAPADLWVRHETDSDKCLLPPRIGNSTQGHYPRQQFQERVFTVHLTSPSVLAAQTFYFNIQSDPCRNRLLWMRMINTHGFSHAADNSFHFDPAKWEAKVYLPRPDGTYVDFIEEGINGRSQARYSDGFPLGQVAPDAGWFSSVVIKVTIRPKVVPSPHSGVCISLWTPGMFGFPDSATATLVFR